MISDSINSDSIYKYVGLFIVSLFVIYIVLRTLNFQAKIIEGMATGSSTTARILKLQVEGLRI